MKMSNILKSRDHNGMDSVIQRLGIISSLSSGCSSKKYEPLKKQKQNMITAHYPLIPIL